MPCSHRNCAVVPDNKRTISKYRLADSRGLQKSGPVANSSGSRPRPTKCACYPQSGAAGRARQPPLLRGRSDHERNQIQKYTRGQPWPASEKSVLPRTGDCYWPCQAAPLRSRSGNTERNESKINPRAHRRRLPRTSALSCRAKMRRNRLRERCPAAHERLLLAMPSGAAALSFPKY